MRRSIAALILPLFAQLAFSAGAAAQAAAPKKFAREAAKLLAQPDAARGFWGIQIVSLGTGKPVYSLNESRLFTPASAAKLFTTAAAFDAIGGDYRFVTTVEAAAPPDGSGTIAGDLTLVGRGDPNLSGRKLPYSIRSERPQPPLWMLDELAEQLASRGVRQIGGDIIGDDTYYPYDRFAEGWSQDDLQWSYGAPVSALSVNDNFLFITITPGVREGDAALLSFDPSTDYYQIENHIMTGAAGPAKKIGIHREPGAMKLEFWGTIPAGSAAHTEELAIEDPAQFAAIALKLALENHGIAVNGTARARHLPLWQETQAAGQSSTVLAKHESGPLFQDLVVINKTSQNLHAELALRLLGRIIGGAGTAEAGLNAVSSFAARAGITPEEFKLHDGSGLSRQDVVTPAAFVKLLQFAAGQPWGARFAETLPAAGSDGSLRERFERTPLAGHLQAKTGGMDHVNTLAGFLTTQRGTRLAFAIMVNNHQMEEGRAKEIIDKLVLAMMKDF